MTATVRAAIMRSFEVFLRRYPGVDAPGLLAGVAPHLAEPEGVLDLRAAHQIFEAAARATGDAAFGLSFAAQLPWQDLGVLGYVLLHSPTVGAAFANAGRYFALQSTGGRSELAVGPDAATLTHSVRGFDRADQVAETVLGIFTRLVREGTGRAAWAPREVRFRHRAPDQAAVQQRFFAAPILYQQGEDALVLAGADLRLPMKTADPGLLPILLRHADEMLARIPAADDFIGDVRRAIGAALRSGEATIEQAAAALDMSPRSVQRRLQELGQTFKGVVAETRLALARRYLEDPDLSLTETAFLLGYADLSAFSRAFKRWTGETPLDARRRG